ncbi:opacity protein-like surface antigen [Haloferula luteola]|uniref:Opacity protein-like surface antigen n=1 Tax=Haloferula luteola TaxID=595692 RepID=A0A840VG93_9BACT|nr:hypothetical protein [Haloferula luteola]MBB5351811.1 opacity protein-like surface antigen [Haloferula luteola]
MKFIPLFLSLPAVALAHHGQDFFLNLDARVPSSGGATVYATSSIAEQDFSLESGFLAGLGSGFAAGCGIDWTDQGSFHTQGLTPMLQWSAPLAHRSWRLGASVSYHFDDGSRQPSSSFTSNSQHGGHHHSHRSMKTFNPDAPPDPVVTPTQISWPSASSSTIHLHDEDYFQSRIILEWSVSESTRAVANFVVAGTSSSEMGLGYAVGLRHEFHHHWGVGLECMGDFNVHGDHQVVASWIYMPRHDLGLRLGYGHGLGSAGEGGSLHAGITWRFE